MRRVLVTGANSFLASALIPRLLSGGYAVRGLVRRASSFGGVVHPCMEIVEGDFSNEATLRRVLPNCDFVVHCAALTAQNAPLKECLRVNTDATCRLMTLADELKIKIFINVSSANIFGFGSQKVPGDESKPQVAPFSESPYAVSKAAVQMFIRGFDCRMSIITIAPTFMIGTCHAGSGSARMVGMAMGHRVVFYPPGGKNFVRVDDVADGIVAALQHGRNRESYLLAGENMTYRQFFGLVKRVEKGRALFVPIVAPVLKVAGVVGDLLLHLSVRTQINSVNMRILCVRNYYTAAKAVRDIGFVSHPIDSAVGDAPDAMRR